MSTSANDPEFAEQDDGNRVRFCKDNHPTTLQYLDSAIYLQEAFEIYDVDEIIPEIQQWLTIALINEHSAYEDGESREDILDFCDAFLGLIEALHILNESGKPDESNSLKKNLQDDLKEEIDKRTRPKYLTPEQIANPMDVVQAFCKRLLIDYVRAELFDLLDSAIIYDGEKKKRLPGRIFYSHINAFYLLSKRLTKWMNGIEWVIYEKQTSVPICDCCSGMNE